MTNVSLANTIYAKKLLFSLFFHSLSIISFQIILMRILSVVQWDHFANMIIGIAMLGFGVSGTLLALTKQKLLKHSEKLIPLMMILSSLFMLMAYRLSQHELFKFDTFLVFSSADQLLRLALFLFLFFLPFFTASLAIGMIYVKYVAGIGKLYFSNLVGSGIGGTIGIIILFYFLPQNALVVATFFPAIASLIIFPRKSKILFISAYTILLIVITWNIIKPVSPSLSQYKSLSRTLLIPDARIKITESGISSMVEIVESEYLRYAPGLSLHFTGQVPVKPMVFVNGNAAGFIPKYQPGQTEDILDFTTYKLPYVIGDFQSVAVIQSGTGTLVAQALRKNANRVFAIESEISMLNALEKWHTENFHSVYSDNKAELHNIEARAFFNNTDEKFDLIVMPSVGSFGGNSGLQAIREEFSLTTQALDTYMQNLSDNGLIAVTVYTDFPPRASLKTTASFIAMLKNYGITNPENHIAAVRSWTAITYIVSKQKLKAKNISDIRNFCNKMGFDPFILPGITNEERIFFNYIEETEIFELTDKILKNESREEIDDYMFYIYPATDNKPYFSRYIKISKLKELLQEYRWQEIPFIELGYIIVWLTFIIALIFSAVLILLPFAWMKKSRGKMPVLFYFGAIGLGFMFAEIILIQRFVLYLGQPVYAVSAVLSIMLLVSGIGSYFSSRVKPDTRKFYIIFILIFLILIIYSLFLTGFLRYTAGYNLVMRVIITCLIVGLPAFFMGMPFPLGLQTLSKQKHDDKLAWAWGINGFFSVIATPMALIIAVEAGSVLVIGLAGIAYLMAVGAIFWLRRKR